MKKRLPEIAGCRTGENARAGIDGVVSRFKVSGGNLSGCNDLVPVQLCNVALSSQAFATHQDDIDSGRTTRMRPIMRALVAGGLLTVAPDVSATELNATVPDEITSEAKMSDRWTNDMVRLEKLHQTAYRTGDHERIIAESAKILSQVQRDSGDQSFDFATMLNAHAMFLNAADRPAEARPLLAQSLQLSHDLVGERHRLTLRNLHNYAFVLVRLGENKSAVPYFDLALRLRSEVLGEFDSQTMLTRVNYAGLLLRLDRAQEAEPLFAVSLASSRQLLGETHGMTIRSRKGYATALAKLGRGEEAKSVLAGQDNLPAAIPSLPRVRRSFER